MRECKTIIDVRNDFEFEEGHVEGSINIPLTEVMGKLEEIKAMDAPVAVCCLSGGRSGNAVQYLEQQGVDCFNAGGWKSVEFAIENGELCLVK